MTDKTDQTGELPPEIRGRLDALDANLEALDHYALLGLERTATRAQVRSAFLAVAPSFHPDRYFGKKIELDYAAKMQRVFARMALAHDTLLDDEKRAVYDSTLPPPPLVAQALGSTRPRSSPPSGAAVSSAPSPASTRPPASGAGTNRPPLSTDVERARAQAFATRLAGGSSRMRVATPAQAGPGLGRPGGSGSMGAVRGSSSSVPAADAKAAGEALRRRYEESKAQARVKQSSHEVQAAEAAAARGDHLEAARLYRHAVEHSSDPAMKTALVRAELKAKEQSRVLALEQARTAEEKQDYTQAAIGWARAFDLFPAADVANRAAYCFWRASNDFRRAARYGEEAVKLDPNKAAYHVTLALAYADAGLVLRAKGEIERAAALDPGSSSVKEAAAKIKALR